MNFLCEILEKLLIHRVNLSKRSRQKMKKTIMILAVAIGFVLTASAERRGHDRDHRDHNDRHDHRYDRDRHYDRNRNCGNDRYYRNTNYRDRYYNNHSTRVRIWVPGYTTRVWCPPRYEYVRNRCGRLVRVCISHGHYKTRYVPGYYRYSSGSCSSSSIRVSWGY